MLTLLEKATSSLVLGIDRKRERNGPNLDEQGRRNEKKKRWPAAETKEISAWSVPSRSREEDMGWRSLRDQEKAALFAMLNAMIAYQKR